MACHAIRIIVEGKRTQAAVNAVDGVQMNFAEAVPDEANPPTPQDFAGPEGKNPVTATAAEYRFDIGENKTELVDAFDRKLPGDAAWYGVFYHECDHDEASDKRTGCGGWRLEEALAPSQIPDVVRPDK